MPSGARTGGTDLGYVLALNNRVQTIRPAINGDGSGQNAIASGWGNTLPYSGPSNLLMNGTMPIEPNSTCDAAPELVRNLYSDEVCAGFLSWNTGACHGDSGGPLSVPRSSGIRELVGIVSWGQPDLCATYTVFGRVTSYVNWIRQYVFDPALVSVLF